MNPEAQRIAIAEACGWKPDDDGDGTGWKGSWIRHRLIGKKPTFNDGKVVSYLIEQTVPDYLNDLNAMHEAENCEALCKISYTSELYVVQARRNPHVGSTEFTALVNSSAAHRAEAFLKTLGIWKEDAQ